jgi:predicted enzyme related to lactoylglutathione lyase
MNSKDNAERRPQIKDGHIFLHVEDLESAKKFYVDILGIQLQRERREWIDLKTTPLGLSESKGAEHQILFHVDNFEEAADILEEKGFKVTRDSDHQGHVKDPFGNNIGLHDHRE